MVKIIGNGTDADDPESSADYEFTEEDLLEYDLKEEESIGFGEDDELEEDWYLSPDDETPQEIKPASSAPIRSGRYVVNQGDCLSSIAFRAGFFPETIWNHGENIELQRKREDGGFLMPGDVIVIPEKQLRQEMGSTEQRYRFRRRGIPDYLWLRPLMVDQPCPDTDYILDIDGHTLRDRTDDEGWIKKAIPPNARKARLTLLLESGREEYSLTLGGVDPLKEITGVQGRLNNLGYDCPLSGVLDKKTKAALATFQEEMKLPVSGEIDEQTRKALRDKHGS